jgi:hypothetical protein
MHKTPVILSLVFYSRETGITKLVLPYGVVVMVKLVIIYGNAV